MKTYIGTKIIQAEPYEKDYGPTETHGQPGYLVVYQDGYTSWSPKADFEEACRETSAMSFGLALEAMKKGKKVARAGWNVKVGMWIGLVNADNYIPWIGMKNADNKFTPWLASQADMLADDWQIVE